MIEGDENPPLGAVVAAIVAIAASFLAAGIYGLVQMGLWAWQVFA